jgi:hypothetical protein
MEGMSLACMACPADRKRPVKQRGVCIECYRKFAYQVGKGLTTWDRLQEEGKVLKKARSLFNRPRG